MWFFGIVAVVIVVELGILISIVDAMSGRAIFSDQPIINLLQEIAQQTAETSSLLSPTAEDWKSGTVCDQLVVIIDELITIRANTEMIQETDLDKIKDELVVIRIAIETIRDNG